MINKLIEDFNNGEILCRIDLVMRIIGGKWKPVILWHLGENKILDQAFAYRFSKIAGFRDFLAHDYEKIEAEFICKDIKIKLDEVDLFIRQIEDYLNLN